MAKRRQRSIHRGGGEPACETFPLPAISPAPSPREGGGRLSHTGRGPSGYTSRATPTTTGKVTDLLATPAVCWCCTPPPRVAMTSTSRHSFGGCSAGEPARLGPAEADSRAWPLSRASSRSPPYPGYSPRSEPRRRRETHVLVDRPSRTRRVRSLCADGRSTGGPLRQRQLDAFPGIRRCRASLHRRAAG